MVAQSRILLRLAIWLAGEAKTGENLPGSFILTRKWIVPDIPANSIQFLLVPDDPFKIITLPDRYPWAAAFLTCLMGMALGTGLSYPKKSSLHKLPYFGLLALDVIINFTTSFESISCSRYLQEKQGLIPAILPGESGRGNRKKT